MHRDGLGAVVKTLLRKMEMNKDFPGHVYMDTVEDGFLFTTPDDDHIDWYGE